MPNLRALRRIFVCACVLAAGAGCAAPSHHVRRAGNRRAPRAEACVPDALPVFNDRGPDRAREAFAVVTAECRESKEEDCRRHLLLGGCEAGADALVDVTNRLVQGRRRMIGTAVEYLGDAPAPSSGGVAAP